MYRTALFLALLAPLSVGYAPGQEHVFFSKLGAGSYLGVNVAEVDGARARELKLKEERGVEVKKVEPDSPAEKAGLKERDVVLEYNGQRVEGTESFIRMVRETPVGRASKLLISRDGNHQTLTAAIAQRKEGSWNRGFNITIPPIPPIPAIDVPRATMTLRTARVGLETETLSGQLADFFGVKDGVLVRSVDADSPAAKAGIKAGDVITKIGDRSVTRTRDVSDEIRQSGDKKTVPVLVIRSRKEMTLNLELPERARFVTPAGRRALQFDHRRL